MQSDRRRALEPPQCRRTTRNPGFPDICRPSPIVLKLSRITGLDFGLAFVYIYRVIVNRGLRRLLGVVVLGGLIGIAAGVAMRSVARAPEPTRAGVLLAIGAAAKADPYAVAQGAVTHGEPVLVDVGDGELVFFVNRPEPVLALVNGCDERVAPVLERRLPVLVEARFRLRTVPPYTVETPSIRYRFSAPRLPAAPPCG